MSDVVLNVVDGSPADPILLGQCVTVLRRVANLDHLLSGELAQSLPHSMGHGSVSSFVWAIVLGIGSD